MSAVATFCRAASKNSSRRLVSIAGYVDHSDSALSNEFSLDFGCFGVFSLVYDSFDHHKSVSVIRNAEKAGDFDPNDSAKSFR